MKTIRDISGALRTAVQGSYMRQADLKARAGVSQRTLTNVLGGNEDYKVSTLLALADRLGLEVLVVPKGVAPVLEAGATSAPLVKSRVQAALERVRRSGDTPSGEVSSGRGGRDAPVGTKVRVG